MHKKKAFTLIELLVVISIIGILAAILTPAALKGVEMAHRSSCANNLKSIGVAFLNYASDHQGELPHYNDLPALGDPFAEIPDFTAIVLAPTVGVYPDYISDLRLWYCPSDKLDYAGEAMVETDPTAFSTLKNCSYMYISGYHLMRSPESPPVAPMLADESNKRELGSATPGNMPPIDEFDNHGASVRNVLFLDGHVVTFKDADAANAIFNNLTNPESICSVD